MVDKLLTGFDAPACTYLYIDKQMQDHGLFQAICRVNRTENEDKVFGYIVDYKDLFESLNNSIADYTSNAMDSFEEKDVKGLLNNRLEKAKERLLDALNSVFILCEPVMPPKYFEQFQHYFCGNTEDKDALKEREQLRLTFYKAVVSLIRAYNDIAPEMTEAGFSAHEAAIIKSQVDEYTELRNSIKNASGDYIDLKKYEPEMRQLLDMYLSADPSRTISNLGDATLIQLIVENGIEAATDKLPKGIKGSQGSMAETLEANMRKVIIQQMPINPVYYESMSLLLTELIRQRKKGAITYEDFLKKIEELAIHIQPKTSNQYPPAITNNAERTFYDNFNKNESLALALFTKIDDARPNNWIGNPMKERLVMGAIRKILNDFGITDEAEIRKAFELATKQNEFQ